MIHRDIKLENIVFESAAYGREGKIKLVDFGASRAVEKPRQRASTQIGTPITMAPELKSIENRNKKVSYHGPAADIYSLGAVAYSLLVADKDSKDWSPHFDSTTSMLLTAHEPHKKYLDILSKECLEFLQQCLAQSPSKRLTTKDALRHPWLAGPQECHVECSLMQHQQTETAHTTSK